MIKSAVYHGNSFLGEVEIYPLNWSPIRREIRISHLSPTSDRCLPLSILLTIAPAGFRFRMESQPPAPADSSPLFSLHTEIMKENKTAVVPMGEEEIHLVAMPSRKKLDQYSCFWGFSVAQRLYNSCLVMLNLRCLGIVFDLDETLIVANSMRSFEDKIEGLQKRISNETDPQRITCMLSEIKRYQDDKALLKQYTENDQVVDDDKVVKVHTEIVPPLSDSHQLISRPIIRLPKKNIILTRVNPSIRDTSVLVKLRPAWEGLKSYVTAKGRKRFEVYVCTMAERDYALEMWRLLDPEANLINSKELLDRIVCVKSGYRKSLLHVFQNGTCHPNMALIIDDRLKVWDEKDQSRVYVVPAFAPYFAPQAEENNTAAAILCLARTRACYVRGGFFKEFDDGMLPLLDDVFYEDEISDLPSAPDVENYLNSEDGSSLPDGNKGTLPFESIADAEAAKRLKNPKFGAPVAPVLINSIDPRAISSIQHVVSSSGIPISVPQIMMPLPISQCPQPIGLGRPPPGFPEPSLQGSPVREEGEVPESELDPDTRRRLLILQHGQDTREPPPMPPPPPPPPPFQLRPPTQVVAPSVQSHGGWYHINEEISPRQTKRSAKEFSLEPEVARFSKKKSKRPSFFHGGDNIIHDRGFNGSQRYPSQSHHGEDQDRSSQALPNYNSFTGEEMPPARLHPTYRDNLGPDRDATKYGSTSVGVLDEIAMKCGSKVEYRTALVDIAELQFSVEVWLVGEKIGDGIGKTRKEAQHLAAEKSIHYLAKKYISDASLDSAFGLEDFSKNLVTKENGFFNDTNSSGYPTSSREDRLTTTSIPGESTFVDHRVEGPKRSSASLSALKDLCTTEGFNLVFQAQPASGANLAKEDDVCAQIEIAGQILGKGIGANWEEAKMQAADEALGLLKSMLGQITLRNSGSRRSPTSTTSQLNNNLSCAVRSSSSSNR